MEVYFFFPGSQIFFFLFNIYFWGFEAFIFHDGTVEENQEVNWERAIGKGRQMTRLESNSGCWRSSPVRAMAGLGFK